jgi:mRNA interferase MazF
MRGDVVVVPFPFNNLSDQKRRPALVLAALAGPDVVLCQITSQPPRDTFSIAVEARDFASGSLERSSTVRTNQIFTLEKAIICYRIGRLKPQRTAEIVKTIVSYLNPQSEPK